MRTLASFVIGGLLAALVAGCVSQKQMSPSAGASSPNEAGAPSGFYIVQPGDTGAKIASKQNLTLGDLVAWNPDVQWTKLKVGQLIRTEK